MTWEEIRDNLMDEARTYAGAKGYRFGDGAEGDFESAAFRAAQGIRNRTLEEQRKALKIYQKNFRRVINEMIRQAEQIPNYASSRPGLIGEETFDAATGKLCPIPPFC